MNMRDSGKTPPRVLGDTGRGALYALLDRAMPGAPSLFPFVHEAAEPLSGGMVFPHRSGRRHLPLHVPPSLSRRSGPTPGVWSRTLGAKLSCLPDQRQDRITERKI
jgi:hypothetical protein